MKNNKKKAISALLGLALKISVLGVIFAAPKFPDVPANCCVYQQDGRGWADCRLRQ